jgi:SAM-dependent methyltransferase
MRASQQTGLGCKHLCVGRSFEELIGEAQAAPIEGWDFGWLAGRATEERPSWRYSEIIAGRITSVSTMLDLQSGGGEMLANLPRIPPLLVAAEGYGPNVVIAKRLLGARGAYVVASEDDRLPFASGAFDLVTSRHPVATCWQEIARVLRPGGTYLSQQVGPYSVRELSEYMLGPLPSGSTREPRAAVRAAQSEGLSVRDLREERLRTVFNDVGAVVYFLRLVIWIVPGFTVERYYERLRALHDQIERDGQFVAYASRFLIEAGKPG